MYDEYYGLAARPFQLSPDPLFYFESTTHRKALSYLGYGLAQGEGFIVITGDIGSGKSTLVSHLMQSIDRDGMTAATIVTSQLDASDLVKLAAGTFGIDTRGLDKAASLRSIENFLHAEARTGRRCLLVVDEAQNLSIEALEELRMLSNFQLGSNSLLQIFLLGQPEFRDLVRDAPELEQMRQRVIATHHLDAMDAGEVEPYVMHRLSRSGWSGNPSFAPEVFDVLVTETGGVPRKINTLMNRVMLMGAVERLSFIDASTVRAVIEDMARKPFAYNAQLSDSVGLAAQSNVNGEGPLNEVLPENYQVDEFEPDAYPRDIIAIHEPLLHPVAAETLTHEEPAAVEPADEAWDEEPYFLTDPLSDQIGEAAADITAAPASDKSQYEYAILNARLVALEKRVSEQDDALRRVLATMIDWMDKESSVGARFQQGNRAA